ncbi:MAG: trimethylamine methyltransferase family protein [Alphaproteobacteria bacterium]
MARRARRTGTARTEAATASVVHQKPFRALSVPFGPIPLISQDEVEAMHEASLTVLEEIGLNFLLPEAREMLAKAGADVDPNSSRVRFDRGFIDQMLSTVPREFTLHARNPAHNVTLGGNRFAICSVASAPNYSDMEFGRRRGDFQGYKDLMRLVQYFNICHLPGGYPVEPVDIPTPMRHIEAGVAAVELTDKVLYAYSLGRDRVLDMLEVAKLSRGIDDATLERETSLWSVINANSPLQYDTPMLWGIIELSKRNQAICITPFTLSGAMAPVTIPGALVQQNAEALAGIAFTQVVRPGAPVIYGGFTSNVDMKSGSPAFGTPEAVQATMISGQLARRYGIPFRASNVNASNAPDAQATYEAQMSIWACMLGHVNLMMHGLGWLEGGLCASFEKFIIDAEMLQMASELMQKPVINEDTLGLDAIREVGPGGHYFAAKQTLSRYEDAFYDPILSDWRNFETWQDDGARTATERAHILYKKILANFKPPALEDDRREALHAFMAKREAEGGAPMQ